MLTLPKTKQLTRIAALTAAILATGCGQQDEETSESKSICGRTNDLQEVPEYDGTLGISIGFVAQHETPVGAILNAGGSPYCSGTLISENLFLTAALPFQWSCPYFKSRSDSALASRLSYRGLLAKPP